MLRELNLDGDGQADLVGHGGIYKAAYVYSIENYNHWKQELVRDDFTMGQFGENLTVDGMLDDKINVGDVFRVGGALVEVTQPVVPVQIELQGHQHPQHFLFVDLHSAADRVGVGRGVEAGRFDQVLSTQQEASALWSPDSFSARKGYQVKTHLGVLEQVVHRWGIGCTVIEGGNSELLSQFNELGVFDLPDTTVPVQKQHQGCLLIGLA